jgi:hypothetical protein
MNATLSGAPREVLRALVHGLDLREVAGKWTFVGHWQDPTRSSVSCAVILELFGFGFICRCDGSRATITKEGERMLSESAIKRIDEAFR